MTDPQFKNACTCGKCQFLGPYKHAGIEYDLYFCTNDNQPGLFVRWGDDASDVEGMPARAQTILSYAESYRAPFNMARCRAHCLNLITTEARNGVA